MTQPIEIVIGSLGGDHVLIRIRTDNDDWRGSEIEIRCDGWTGRTNADFHKGELGLFGKQVRELRRNLSKTAELSPLEPNLTLSLIGDGKGHIRVEGIGQNHFERPTRLKFSFDIDQTFLEDIAKALMEADPVD